MAVEALVRPRSLREEAGAEDPEARGYDWAVPAERRPFGHP